jgi:proteasome activator subunit 4
MVGDKLAYLIVLRSYFVAVPSNEEISFIIEILDHIVSPALDKLEALLPAASSWDGIARNDFCRYAQATVVAIWNI